MFDLSVFWKRKAAIRDRFIARTGNRHSPVVIASLFSNAHVIHKQFMDSRMPLQQIHFFFMTKLGTILTLPFTSLRHEWYLGMQAALWPSCHKCKQ